MAKASSGNDKGSDSKMGGAVAPDSGGSILGMVASVFILAVTAIATLINKAWHSITEGGHVKAAFRQGADEIGEALKAFPDSISVQEPGAILNPTQGEIAADRKPAFQSSYYSSFSSTPAKPWPSEVARDHQSDTGSGRDRGSDLDGGSSL